ncbi:cell surface glycoprotein CD200 receptor 1-like [Rhynchocyon petersi]
MVAGNTSLSVLVNTKAVLLCPPHSLTALLVVTWKILLRDNTSCTKAYSREKNEITDTNCIDSRITWISRPDQNASIQIDPVAITHDGTYTCKMTSPKGTFCHDYHIQVLAPPQVTMSVTKNRTAVCKAAEGKPAAQISWTPEGSCVTIEQEGQGKGEVSVQSECHWEDSSVSTVTCFVSHLTGNKTLSLELQPVADEMQPYARYTEKSNPLYDTAGKVKTS